MEIKLEDYITEEEKKEIIISQFKEDISKMFGGDEYSTTGKDRDRIIKNSVAHWITEYIEKTLTEEDKNIIKENVMNTIRSKNDLSFYIFQKPDVWDRTEYTAYKIIQTAVKENEQFIKDKVTESIKQKFTLQD